MYGMWHEREGRLHGDEPTRFSYAPYEDFDFLLLPSPIATFVSGPLGVTFQCFDGVYHLSGSSNDPLNTWRVEKVWAR